MKAYLLILVSCFLTLFVARAQTTQSDVNHAIELAKSGRYEEASKFFIREYNRNVRDKDTLKMMITSRMLGNTFLYLKDYKNAHNYFENTLKLSRLTHDEFEEVSSLMSLAVAYEYKDDFETALRYNIEAFNLLKVSKDTMFTNDRTYRATIAMNTGSIYGRKKEPEKALQYYLVALRDFESFDEPPYQITATYSNLGAEYLDLKQYDKSHYYYQKAIKSCIERNQPQEAIGIFRGISKLYKAQGKYELAMKYLDKSVQFKDSIYDESVLQSVEELNSRFESERKEKEIKDLNQQNKEKTQKIDAKNKWIYALIAGALLIGIIGLLFLLRQRDVSKRKQAEFAQKKAELKQQALRAQMNPHFLFNSLNSIQRLYVEGNTITANDYMADFSSLLRKIINSTSLESISVKEDIDMLRLYLDLEKMRTDHQIDYHIQLDHEINMNSEYVPPLIIQPFVENAIWHGVLPTKKNGTININLKKASDDRIVCTVEDNGVGYFTSLKTKSSAHESKGMKITEERLGIHNAVQINEKENGGTIVTIQIPVSHD